MTELFRKAVETAKKLPDDVQDEIARAMFALAGEDRDVYELTAEEKASLASSLAQAERGEFASDGEVASVWAKHAP